MAKREKILMLGALLAALFGAFHFLRPQPGNVPPEHPSVKIGDSRDLIEKIRTDLKKQSLSEAETSILAKAAVDWGGDPFVGKKLLPLSEASRLEIPSAQDIFYTGYISSGSQKLAIINGLEYEVGDQLVNGGFIIRKIDPRAVVLESIGVPGTVSIPFVDE